MPTYPEIEAGNQGAYMEYTLEQARLSPPASTKFCVSAALIDEKNNEILSTGYSLEVPRDTLEQNSAASSGSRLITVRLSVNLCKPVLSRSFVTCRSAV